MAATVRRSVAGEVWTYSASTCNKLEWPEKPPNVAALYTSWMIGRSRLYKELHRRHDKERRSHCHGDWRGQGKVILTL